MDFKCLTIIDPATGWSEMVEVPVIWKAEKNTEIKYVTKWAIDKSSAKVALLFNWQWSTGLSTSFNQLVLHTGPLEGVSWVLRSGGCALGQEQRLLFMITKSILNFTLNCYVVYLGLREAQSLLRFTSECYNWTCSWCHRQRDLYKWSGHVRNCHRVHDIWLSSQCRMGHPQYLSHRTQIYPWIRHFC